MAFGKGVPRVLHCLQFDLNLDNKSIVVKIDADGLPILLHARDYRGGYYGNHVGGIECGAPIQLVLDAAV